MFLVIISSVFCAIFVSAKFLLRSKKNVSNAALLLLIPILCASVLSFVSFDKRIIELSDYDGVTDHVTVTVKEVRFSSSYYGYYVAEVKGSTVKSVTVYLGVPDGSCSVGDVLEGEVTFHTIENSKMSENKSFLLSDGIFMTAESEGMNYVGRDESFSFSGMFKKLNSYLSAKLISSTKGEGSLACAVLLGDRSYLPATAIRDFSRLGISHLLAISGIHLSVIIAVSEILLSKSKMKKGIKSAFLAVITLFYMALVGFSPSVTRAGIMHLIRISASAIDRKSDAFTSLALAAALIVAVNPASAYDISLMLSVMASYACIVYADHMKQRKKYKQLIRHLFIRCADTVKTTLLVIALTLPVTWKMFGEVSLISPLTNIIFIPVVSVYLYASLIYSVLVMSVGAPFIFTRIICLFEDIIFKAAERISTIPGIVLSLRHKGSAVFVTLLFVSVLLATVLYKKRKALCKIIVGASVFCFASFIVVNSVVISRSCSLDFLSRGKSDGFVLRKGNSFTLVDVSDGSSGFSYDLIKASRESGMTEADSLVLTHLHKKHVTYTAYLADSVILRRVYIPSPENDEDIAVCESIIKSCNERGVDVTVYSRSFGEVIDMENASISLCDYTLLKRSTHPVITFGIELGNEKFVYAGGSSNESVQDISNLISTADTVFFGVHPPIYKSPSKFTVNGNGVFTNEAADEEYLSTVIIGGERTVMEEDGMYSTESSLK